MSALVTPYGTGILGYYPSLLGNPNLRYIGEWQHASLGGQSIPFLVLLLGTASYVAFAARRRGVLPDPFLGCLAAALTLMGFQAIRYQVWFALIAALLVSDLSTRARRRRRRLLSRADICLVSLPPSPASAPWSRLRSLPQRRLGYSREKRRLLRFERPHWPRKRHMVGSSPMISQDQRFPGFTRNSPGEWPLTLGRRFSREAVPTASPLPDSEPALASLASRIQRDQRHVSHGSSQALSDDSQAPGMASRLRDGLGRCSVRQ